MAQMTRARARNQQLRDALRPQFHGCALRVGNGRNGSALISWVNGPTPTQVELAVRAAGSDTENRPWSVETRRTVSDELVVVSYLRAADAGEQYYTRVTADGRTVLPGEHAPLLTCGGTLSARVLVEHLDARTVTDDELRRARTLIMLAGWTPPLILGGSNNIELAESVYNYRSVCDAVLAAPTDHGRT